MEMNKEWLTENNHRSYPISQEATQRDAQGNSLPNNIIIDATVVYDNASKVYVTSLVVTPSLVSITFATASGAILAGTYPTPVATFVALPLQAVDFNSAGFVVFGSGINEQPRSHIFTTEAQSYLDNKAARRFSSLPITSLEVANNPDSVVSGLVRLAAGGALKIEYVGNNVVELSLNEEAQKDFLSKCDSSVGVAGCGLPVLRTINGVGPDANGNLFVEVK